MPSPDTLWFVPFDSPDEKLQSPYSIGSAGAIAAAQPFTVSLDAVKLAKEPPQSFLEKILGRSHDVLILSSSALGAKPPVERVHYYKASVDLEKPLLLHDLLSDTMCVCDDYKEDALFLELKVVTIETAGEHRDAALKGFETLLSTAGSVFPVVLPYTALGTGAAQALNKLWSALEQRETWRLSEPIRLKPPKTEHAKMLREGRFVVFNREVDGTQYKLGDGGQLEGDLDKDMSYVVFRIDPGNKPSQEYVISQRVATLLTQLTNDEGGMPAGMLETSLGYVTDTLKAYTNFNTLKRYLELKKKTDRSEEENKLMGRIEDLIAGEPELQPFLPLKELPAAA